MVTKVEDTIEDQESLRRILTLVSKKSGKKDESKPKKILLIDDDTDFLEMHTAVLAHRGYEVIAAQSSKEGMEKLEETKPDIVILDVMMPGMIHNVLCSMQYLINYLPTFTERGVRGIEANVARASETVARNPAIATLLAPAIGYLVAAALAKEAVELERPVLDLAVERGIIDGEERARLLRELGIGE